LKPYWQDAGGEQLGCLVRTDFSREGKMVSVCLSLVLLSAFPSNVVLLDFSAPWCGPCRSMEPTVASLSAAGYPIRKVNIDAERELASRFGISSIPCFVLTRDGKELGRIVGPASAGELQQLFVKHDATPPAPVAHTRGQSPDAPLNRIASNSAGHRRLLGGATAPAPTSLLGNRNVGARAMPASNPAPDDANPFRRTEALAEAEPQPLAGQSNAQSFIQYAARLKIEDANGSSYGTGTIIDTRGEQALILTCGHIFRESQGQGSVLVDLFVPGAPGKLPGKVVSYDLKRDVALVSVRPGVRVTPAKVAPDGYRSQVGDRVVTVGCNNGGEPTVEESHVIAVDKFVGPANVQVAGQPVQGRSGGGLFIADGMVIGVCNAADPTDNAGLYAAAAAVHEELDSARLSSIYRRQAAGGSQLLAGTSTAGNPPAGVPDAAELRTMAEASSVPSPHPSASETATLASLQSRADAEVICIVRPRDPSHTKSEVIVLDRASSVFLDQLDAERAAQQSRRLTSHEVRGTEWRRQ
jgi:thiol-disulfide isomerase/thioredoxin